MLPVFKKLKISIKIRHKKFLQEKARDWLLEKEKEGSTSTEDQLTDHQPIPRGPKKDKPGRLSADFRKNKLGGGEI
jgi:hypothetical protein